MAGVGGFGGELACRPTPAQGQHDIFGTDPDARIMGGSSLRLRPHLWRPAATCASIAALLTDESCAPADTLLCLVPAAGVQLERRRPARRPHAAVEYEIHGKAMLGVAERITPVV